MEIVLNQRLYGLPLVVAQIVYQYEKQGLIAIVKSAEHLVAHHSMRHCGLLGTLAGHPIAVVTLYVARKLSVGLLFLHEKHLFYALVGRFLELQLPTGDVFVHRYPLVEIEVVGQFHTNLAKLLLIFGSRLLVNQLFIVQITLERKQNLIGIDRFYKVIGYFTAYGVLHNALLLALGNHHHRKVGKLGLYLFQSLHSRNARHLLIKENNVETAVADLIQSLAAVNCGLN